MKVLLVGDVHATPDELDDCQALVDFIAKTAKAHDAQVLFLGDQYHCHNVIRVEVLAFWRNAFRQLMRAGLNVASLVGNHDLGAESGDPRVHAMLAHEEQITVIDKPLINGNVLFLPYFHDNDEFLDACKMGGRSVICHGTFWGSQYENGFYAPEGIDPDKVPQDTIISGHIHLPQEFGKVHYVGAPRWRSLSDAGTDRALWLYDFDDGKVVSKQSFDTGEVVRQIRYVLDTPEAPFDGVIDPKHDYRIDVKGPASFLETRKALLAGPGVKLRTFNTQRSVGPVRESEGIPFAFAAYLAKSVSKFGTPNEVLASMAKERIHGI